MKENVRNKKHRVIILNKSLYHYNVDTNIIYIGSENNYQSLSTETE